MNPPTNSASSCKFTQVLVDQKPRFEHRVVTSRKAGIRRPDKRSKKAKFL